MIFSKECLIKKFKKMNREGLSRKEAENLLERLSGLKKPEYRFLRRFFSIINDGTRRYIKIFSEEDMFIILKESDTRKKAEIYFSLKEKGFDPEILKSKKNQFYKELDSIINKSMKKLV